MSIKDRLIYLLCYFLDFFFSKISKEYYKFIPLNFILKSSKIIYNFKNKNKDGKENNSSKLLKKLINKELKIGIIPDGNRRYYKKYENETEPLKMYRTSFSLLKNLINFSEFLGIKVLTVYCLSVKNLERSENEVKALFKLLEEILDDYLNEKEKKREREFRMKFYGDLNLLPKKILKFEGKTLKKSTNSFEINFLVGYSGTKDLRNYEMVSSKFYRPCLLNLDLIIRTGETYRLSDFMLYSFKNGTQIIFLKEMFPELNYLYFFYLILKNIF